MATGPQKPSGIDVARSAISGAKRTKSTSDGTAVTKTAVARSAATNVAKKRARQVVVHTATKNPYALGVVLVVVVVLLLCVSVAVLALPTTTEPNLLALQLSVANNDPQMPGGGTADIPPIVYSAYAARRCDRQSSTRTASCAPQSWPGSAGKRPATARIGAQWPTRMATLPHRSSGSH